MGLMSFMKEAGEKLFGRGEAKAAQEAAAATPTPEKVAALSKTAGDAIARWTISNPPRTTTATVTLRSELAGS